MTEAEWLAYSDPRSMFWWLRRSGATDRHRLGLLFAACCDLIPPSVAERSHTGAPWGDDGYGQDALTDAEYHLSEAVQEAMRAIGDGDGERAAVCALFRDIFGNPFRPPHFDPDWRTDTVVMLAKQMYESRDFSAMPILADALQDAGCDNDDILAHCRSGGTHVRGCWVLDFVLGRE